jgi:ubiquinone biosynthesis protein
VFIGDEARGPGHRDVDPSCNPSSCREDARSPPIVRGVLVFVARSLRFLALTALLVPVFLVRRLGDPAAGPRVLRWYFQTSGATFVKLGQLLATRYDLLPPAYCEELATLLDSLPPEPLARIVATIERDLGRPLAACFEDFESVPLASASVAQVHGARLHGGERVVVKVLRPGIEQRFHVDFFYFRLIAWFIHRLGVLPNVDLREIVRELRKLSSEETDLRREARNLREMRDLMACDDIDHYAPRVCSEYSARAVLTMERIDGVPVTKLCAAVEEGDQTRLAAWAEAGVTPKRTARVILRSLLEQTYRHRVFQVDPHPGNLFVTPGGTVAWVDFGLVGWLDERIWAQQLKLRMAIASGKLHSAYLCLIATLEPLPPGKDLSRFETEIKEYLRDWTLASRDPGATIAEKSSGYFLIRSFDAVRRAGLYLPTNTMRLYRSMILGDMVMLKLDPTIDWAAGVHEFVLEESERQLKVLAAEATTVATVSTALRAMVGTPHAAMELVDWIENRLPELGRAYGDHLSRFESSLFLTLRYVQFVLVVAWLLLLGAGTIAPRLAPAGAWAELGASTGRAFWPLVILGGATAVFLGKLVHGFRRP